MEDLLGGSGGVGGSGGGCLSSAVLGVMPGLPAFETSSLPHALRLFLGSELFKSDRVDVHSV